MSTSAPRPSLQHDICFVKVSVKRKWKQLFLEGCGIYLFLYFTDIFTNYPQKNHEKKILDPRNAHEKKDLDLQKLKRKNLGPTTRNFGPMKYPREKMLDSWNAHEKKFRTNEIPSRINLEPTKYPREKFQSSEIPTRKSSV